MALSDEGSRTFSMGWGIAFVIASVGLVVGGVLAFALGAPSHIDLVSLQWAGSANKAIIVVGHGRESFRHGIYWDFALVAGFTLGLLAACYLGRRVFWTAGLLRWAVVGFFATVLAAVTNILQDVLLLIALRSTHISGTWIFRIAAAASFIKFTSLLVVVPIGLLALASAISRLVTNKGFVRRWKEAEANAEARRPVNGVAPLIIPPSHIESDRTVDPRKPQNESKKQLVSEDWGLQRKIALDASIDRSWWHRNERSSTPVHFTQDSQSPGYPFGATAICLSGGGIRSASVALGAVQCLRDELGDFSSIDHIVSVSGGGYTNGGIALALSEEGGGPTGLGGAKAGDVFAPGSPEEDHLRRHSSYLSDGAAQWLVALGVLLRNLLASLLIIGLSVATLGLALGFFFRHVPIVQGGLEALRTRLLAGAGVHAPGYPSVPWGVTLGVASLYALVLLLYLVELVWWSLKGSRPASMARLTAGGAMAALVLVFVGIVLPAVVWISSWVTWHIGISSKPMVAVASVSATISYVAVLASALWKKRQYVSTAMADVKKGEKVVSGVLPGSLVQRIVIWIALLALLVTALMLASWVATSGLDDSWWAFLVVGPLLFLAIFLDQTAMSLHPFYRRRLASAFAVRRRTLDVNGQPTDGSSGIAVAVPYSYDESTPLSTYGVKRPVWPRVTFAASANLTGQSRTSPGRPSVCYSLSGDYVGGPEVGWIRTDFLQELVSGVIGKDLTVEAAVAISGAAIASAMGAQTRDYEVFLALTNVRLGAWLPNPRFLALKSANDDNWTVPGLPRLRGLTYFAREIFGIHSDHSRLLLCTDGGHYDNLGLVETLRHRPTLIYCFDASGATQPMADTLAGALMLAREELGVEIDLQTPEQLTAGSGSGFEPKSPFAKLNARLSKSVAIEGTITYPAMGNQPKKTGRLIFAQADLTKDLPYDIVEYTQDDPAFPNDGTADQWFDCNRFDAYKKLGCYLAEQAEGLRVPKAPPSPGGSPVPTGGAVPAVAPPAVAADPGP